jgi:hypothetical protein
MEETTQIRLFTKASAVMEVFLNDDDAKAFSGFAEDFLFSDPKGIFRNDVGFFRSFLKHLESSTVYNFRWKMRRYVGNDIESALYFNRKDAASPDKWTTIMAWMFIPKEGKATRLSLDYNPDDVITELSVGRMERIRNRMKYRMGRYSLEF